MEELARKLEMELGMRSERTLTTEDDGMNANRLIVVCRQIRAVAVLVRSVSWPRLLMTRSAAGEGRGRGECAGREEQRLVCVDGGVGVCVRMLWLCKHSMEAREDVAGSIAVTV